MCQNVLCSPQAGFDLKFAYPIHVHNLKHWEQKGKTDQRRPIVGIFKSDGLFYKTLRLSLGGQVAPRKPARKQAGR